MRICFACLFFALRLSAQTDSLPTPIPPLDFSLLKGDWMWANMLQNELIPADADCKWVRVAPTDFFGKYDYEWKNYECVYDESTEMLYSDAKAEDLQYLKLKKPNTLLLVHNNESIRYKVLYLGKDKLILEARFKQKTHKLLYLIPKK